MDKLFQFLSYILGILLVPFILFLIYKTAVFLLPYWIYVLFGMIILGIIGNLFGFSSSNKSKDSPLEGSYTVFTTDPEGKVTYNRHTVIKDRFSNY